MKIKQYLQSLRIHHCIALGGKAPNSSEDGNYSKKQGRQLLKGSNLMT